jgi:DNA-binding NarL/FixJ family response regulator
VAQCQVCAELDLSKSTGRDGFMHRPMHLPFVAMIQVLIVDDHPLYARGLMELLTRSDAQYRCEVVGSAREARRALAIRPDIAMLLCDWRLPDEDGLSFLKGCANAFPTVVGVLMSGVEDAHLAHEASSMGLMGYLPKALSPEDTLAALKQIDLGAPWFPSNASKPQFTLTPRQLDILEHLVRGDSNKRIALDLNVTERTIKFHVSEIMQRLGASSRTEVVAFAMRHRLVRGANTWG